jgi:lysyl-tRNA synthetase class II
MSTHTEQDMEISSAEAPRVEISKSQQKKLAKLAVKKEKKEATLKARMEAGDVISPNVSSGKSTAEDDYEHRLNLIDGFRKVCRTLYQPPFPVTHPTWQSIIDTHFKTMKKEEMIGKHTDDSITTIGTISSVRSAGRLGFLTVYYPPESVEDGDNEQLGMIMRPEIQIMLRPQTLRLCTIEQVHESDDAFPGLTIPKYQTVEKEYKKDDGSIDEESQKKESTKFIKEMSQKHIRVFDQYYVVGYPGYSNTGERTIYAKYIFPASLNHQMANSLHGAEEHGVQNFSNPEVMFRTPFLRWLYDTESIRTQHIRTEFKRQVRQYLDDMGLMDIDIPHLLSVASGANAKPFTTHQHDGDIDFSLRIAPELELKMGIVGGLSSAGNYHIGSQFRNEGADSTHNPEFTSVEFYARMMSFHQLLRASEDLIHKCCLESLRKTTRITMDDVMSATHEAIVSKQINSSVFVKEDRTGFMIQWDKPFVNIDFVDGINQNMKVGKLPEPSTFDTSESIEQIKQLARNNGVDFKETDSVAKVLDNMFDELVLPNTFRDDLPNSYFKERDDDGNLIITPVTVYCHPKIMSPLAMEIMADGVGTGKVYRFESFVAGMEICNAYQELSDPKVQRENFETQRKFQESGDDEAMTQNDAFLRGLEYGMTPVSGWGMGLERMYMILSNNFSIKNVLPFPQIK